jgi:hypothetical protein
VINERNIIISLVDIYFQQLPPFNVRPECVWELSIQRGWMVAGGCIVPGGRSGGGRERRGQSSRVCFTRCKKREGKKNVGLSFILLPDLKG